MKGYTAKSFHSFAHEMASALEGKTIINAEVIKEASAPLIFGMPHHAAVAAMKAEPKTAKGMILKHPAPLAISDKLSDLAFAIRHRVEFEKHASIAARPLLSHIEDFVVTYGGELHFDVIKGTVDNLIAALNAMMNKDFSSSSMRFEAGPGQNFMGCEVMAYHKELNISYGENTLSLEVIFHDDEYNGTDVFRQSEIAVNGTELIALLDYNDEDWDNVYYLVEMLRETLCKFMKNHIDEFCCPDINISPRLMEALAEELG